jgi:uncharacterized protein YdhG (YjbR/CyaY superfamily)
MAKSAAPRTIDEYIAGYPREVQAILRKIRVTIRKAAPGAQETISYQIPTFKLNGMLISFAAFSKHIGLYPAPSGSERFNRELAAYKTSKATVKFPLDKPVPYALVTRIVKLRVKANREKAATKAKR